MHALFGGWAPVGHAVTADSTASRTTRNVFTGAPPPAQLPDLEPRPSDLEPRTSNLGPRTSDLGPRTSDLGPRTSDLALLRRDHVILEVTRAVRLRPQSDLARNRRA